MENKSKYTDVDKAIAKGHRMLTFPSLAIILTGVGLLLYLIVVQKLDWQSIPALLLVIAVAWLYWSHFVTKWKVWAFENTRNVHELKTRAIEEKILWPDGSFFNKTEIWSPGDKLKWQALQYKFQLKDEVHITDDPLVPDTTVIFYSQTKVIVEIIVALGCIAVGIYLITLGDRWILGALMICVCTFFGAKDIMKLRIKTPQITLSSKGIETAGNGFIPWSDITNERVAREGSGRDTHDYLTFNFTDGSEHLLIDDLNIDRARLNYILKIYRVRFVSSANSEK